jgi:hypothetical protein
VDADRFALWDGLAWHGLGFGSGGSIYAIAIDGTDIYVGGYFTSAGSVSTRAIARYDGAAWNALGLGLSVTPSAHAIGVTNLNVYVGGAFTETYDDKLPVLHIARWEKGGEPPVLRNYLPIVIKAE